MKKLLYPLALLGIVSTSILLMNFQNSERGEIKSLVIPLIEGSLGSTTITARLAHDRMKGFKVVATQIVPLPGKTGTKEYTNQLLIILEK